MRRWNQTEKMIVTEETVARINALAHKAKSPEGLTPEEQKEQAELRAQYVKAFRENLRAQLDNIDLVDEKGNVIEHVADRRKPQKSDSK